MDKERPAPDPEESTNPPGGEMHRDHHGMYPSPYTGPVPIVTHVHGAHVGPESDGFPEAWWLPAANNIPEGYATTGTLEDHHGRQWEDVRFARFEPDGPRSRRK